MRAVASFHGGLATRAPARAGEVRARVLICTGAADPHAPRQAREAIEDELSARASTGNCSYCQTPRTASPSAVRHITPRVTVARGTRSSVFSTKSCRTCASPAHSVSSIGWRVPSPPADAGHHARRQVPHRRVLAVGGMGAVYVGTHIKLRKRVALKVLNPALSSPPMIERFHREAIRHRRSATKASRRSPISARLPRASRFW